MKEIVLTRPPYMNRSEQRIADMHTVINILNIVIGELSLMEPGTPDLVERSGQLDADLHAIAREIKEGGHSAQLMSRIRKCEEEAISLAIRVLEGESAATRRAEIKETITNLKSVFSIFKERLDELELRLDDPDVWILIEPDAFRKKFEDVFTAIARNSKGSYEIHFDLAQKEEGDYHFDLKLDVRLDGGEFWIPLRLIDVLRDLAANARKYTPPGGKVALSVSQDESRIEAVVEDTGCGIPEDEIEKVAEFGYRASNVCGRPTLGGGFGLTKAAWLVTSWGGSLTIQSEKDAGTVVRLSVSNNDLPPNPLSWKG